MAGSWQDQEWFTKYVVSRTKNVCAHPEVMFFSCWTRNWIWFYINMNQYSTMQYNTIEQLMHNTVLKWNDCSHVVAVRVVLISVSIATLTGRTISMWKIVKSCNRRTVDPGKLHVYVQQAYSSPNHSKNDERSWFWVDRTNVKKTNWLI